ncbi:MAG: dihydrofolate reductase [Pseudomonadota bacterium]
MKIALIWAMTRNRVIGRDNDLPWHLPDDLRYFMRTTTGHPVIMGRATFESVGARPLPRRLNIILTSRPQSWQGVEVTPSLDDALDIARARCAEDGVERCFVAGGSGVYRTALPLADELFITEIDAEIEGDTYFPEFDRTAWRLVVSDPHPIDDRHAHAFSMNRYERA